MSIHSSDDESLKFSINSINNKPNDETEENYSTYEEFFIDAVRYKDFGDVEECLLNKVDLLTKDENGNNFCHLLAANGGNKIFNHLKNLISEIDFKFLVNSKNNLGNLPLHWSVFNKNDIEITKILLDYSDCVETKNHNDETPMDFAIQFSNEKFIEYYSFYIGKNQEKLDKTIFQGKLNPDDIENIENSYNELKKKDKNN